MAGVLPLCCWTSHWTSRLTGQAERSDEWHGDAVVVGWAEEWRIARTNCCCCWKTGCCWTTRKRMAMMGALLVLGGRLVGCSHSGCGWHVERVLLGLLRRRLEHGSW